jgi:hypothetical protein
MKMIACRSTTGRQAGWIGIDMGNGNGTGWDLGEKKKRDSIDTAPFSDITNFRIILFICRYSGNQEDLRFISYKSAHHYLLSSHPTVRSCTPKADDMTHLRYEHPSENAAKEAVKQKRHEYLTGIVNFPQDNKADDTTTCEMTCQRDNCQEVARAIRASHWHPLPSQCTKVAGSTFCDSGVPAGYYQEVGRYM